MSNWKLANASFRHTGLHSVSIAAPGTADTWSAWTDFTGGTTPRNVQGLVISRTGPATNQRWRLELGFDSGNAVVVTNGLPFAGTSTVNDAGRGTLNCILPLSVPAGVTLSGRLQSDLTTGTASFSVRYIVGSYMWPIAPCSLIDVQGWQTGVKGTNCAANTNTQIATVSSTRELRSIGIAIMGDNTGAGSLTCKALLNASADSEEIADRLFGAGSLTQHALHSVVDVFYPCNVAKSSAVYARVSAARSVLFALGY